MSELASLALAHLRLTAIAIAAASLVGIAAGVAARRDRRVERVVIGGASLVQTIPAIALLAVMVPLLAWIGERSGLGPAELHRHRVLGRIEPDEPRPVAMDHRAGGDHLGIDQRAARQRPVEEPAMPVRPVHHGGDREQAVQTDHTERSAKHKPT